jgi:hypothetical protein
LPVDRYGGKGPRLQTAHLETNRTDAIAQLVVELGSLLAGHLERFGIRWRGGHQTDAVKRLARFDQLSEEHLRACHLERRRRHAHDDVGGLKALEGLVQIVFLPKIPPLVHESAGRLLLARRGLGECNVGARDEEDECDRAAMDRHRHRAAHFTALT